MPVDVRALHLEVQIKYAEVALEPTNQFHFHTGRRLAEKVGYSQDLLARDLYRLVSCLMSAWSPSPGSATHFLLGRSKTARRWSTLGLERASTVWWRAVTLGPVCPAGHPSIEEYELKDAPERVEVHFAGTTCEPCPLRR